MNLTRFLPLIACWLAFSASSLFAASDPPTDFLSAKVVPFTAIGADGKPVAMSALPDTAATVVVFLSFDCPVSNSYAAPLNELAKTYAAKGVKVFGVASGEEHNAALAKKAKEFQLGFPLLADPKHTAADAVKAVAVPEAFVLDRTGTLRYRGRIDNSFSAQLKRNAVTTSFDLTDALDAVLAGKPVKTPATLAIGCPVFRNDPAPVAVAKNIVTFHKDVLPVLQAHCQSCHRQGQVGPFSLMTYKQAVNWADDIKSYTQDHQMPPWKPVGGPGYKNDRRMPEADITTLAKWVEAGCPEGDPKQAPAPKVFAEGWELGEPDLVLTVPEEFYVGATGRDMFRCFVLPSGLTEDKYVIGYEVKPGNPRVVHHTLNFWDRTGKGRELEAKEKAKPARPDALDHGPGYTSSMGIGFAPTPVADRPGVPPVGAMGGWAPGMRAMQMPEGAGYFLPKGSDIILQTHYHRTGKAESDRIQIGFYFAKKPIERPWQTLAASGMSPIATIPAGVADHAANGSVWLTTEANIHSVMPHMHLIGKSIKVTMTKPGEKPTVLVDIPQWDYNWQETYWLKTPILAPAGTRFDVEAVYDNSSSNPNNPNHPPRRVYFGEETTNEMLFGFIGATPVGSGRVRSTRFSPELRKQLEQLQKTKPAEDAKPAEGAKPEAKPAPGNVQRFEIPYRLTDTKHVLVRAKLNGKGPFNFILDTGAPAVFLGKKAAKAAGVEPARDGWGTFQKFELEGGLVVPNARTRVDDLFQLEGMNGMGLAGVELHGVIGYTVLAKYRITYDFTSDKLAWVPLDFTPPPVLPIGKGGQGSLDALGPAMKFFAGIMGIQPNFQRIPRGRIGIEVEDRNGGVFVSAVYLGSSAEKAGLKVGDKLDSVDAKAVKSTESLRSLVASLAAGQTIAVNRTRDGQEAAVRVSLEEGF